MFKESETYKDLRYTASDLYDFAGSVLKKCPVVLLYKKRSAKNISHMALEASFWVELYMHTLSTLQEV